MVVLLLVIMKSGESKSNSEKYYILPEPVSARGDLKFAISACSGHEIRCIFQAPALQHKTWHGMRGLGPRHSHCFEGPILEQFHSFECKHIFFAHCLYLYCLFLVIFLYVG